jgi:hypothetical protein
VEIKDERAWSLPDGFKREPDDPDGFQKIGKAQRDAFAKSGTEFNEFNGFTAVEANRQAEANTEAEIARTLQQMDPEFRKLIEE